MKIFHLTIVMAASLLLGACSDVAKDAESNNVQEGEVLGQQHDIMVSQRADGVLFTWNSDAVSNTQTAYYTLEIAPKGTNFVKVCAPLRDMPDTYKYFISTEELAALAHDCFGVENATAASAEARVKVSASAKPALEEIETYKMPQALYMIGDATPTGWDPVSPTIMKPGAIGVYVWEGELIPGELKFITTLGEFVPSFNSNGNDGIVLRKTFDDPDVKFNITKQGYYRVAVDFINTKCIITNIEYPEITSKLSIDLHTDKSVYKPGETVTITRYSGSVPDGAMVRYRHGTRVLGEYEFPSTRTWTWQPPTEDYKGYLIDVYTKNDNGEYILGTVAVDVSSDWGTFPRYGFVSDYNSGKTKSQITTEGNFLKRCHINGIQFYDWHYKHHWPLGGTRDKLMTEYTDLANRQVVTSVVKNYIEEFHSLGMKTMFYNLCYGGFDDAESDGVSQEWGLFKSGDNHSKENQDYHGLPSSWKSNIYLYDVSNTEWQKWLAERNDDVYHNFDFDGFHVDQLGWRGDRYNYWGGYVNFPDVYGGFLQAMKRAHSDKRLVFNAVGGWGAEPVARSGVVDFLYHEMWAGEGDYVSFYNHIKNNDNYSNHQLRTIFAAYMNFNMNGGYFNIPGVLLTDAVIFSLGGAHLELGGDHMLHSEYFPSQSVKMNAALKSAITRYYDFLVAYENLLRGDGEEIELGVASNKQGVTINSWPPQMGKVSAFVKNVDGKKVIHLINFSQANSLSWRDLDGTMPEPEEISPFRISVKCTDVHRVWMASPDYHGGVPQSLPFTASSSLIKITLPALKYWDMIVIE